MESILLIILVALFFGIFLYTLFGIIDSNYTVWAKIGFLVLLVVGTWITIVLWIFIFSETDKILKVPKQVPDDSESQTDPIMPSPMP